MKLCAQIRYDHLGQQWLLSLWHVADHGRYLFGQKAFDDWQEALDWAIRRVGLRG